MDKNQIIEKLKKAPGIQEVEEINYKADFLVLRFFYDYDEDELEAASDYANSQSDADDDEDKWYGEYYIPYIIDVAVDEVRDTIEEMVEELDISAEYVSYEPDKDDESCEFIAAFAAGGTEFDIDKILDELEL